MGSGQAVAKAAVAEKIKRTMASKEAFWGYVFVSPIIVGFLVFTLIPIIASLYLSLTEFDAISAPKFIGLDNYKDLYKDADFKNSLLHTFYFTVGTVPVGTCLSLLVAVGLNAKLRFATIYRTAYFLPVVTAMVAVAQVWKWLYNSDYGLINFVLEKLHLFQPPWLASEHWAMPSIFIMSIWKGIGFNMVIFLAGLQGISPSLYEAAVIDGASGVQRFFKITVPMLRHTTFFVVVMSIIGSFQVFDQVYIMTGGGPAKSTQVVVFWIYQNAFQFFKQGYASAMAYVLFAIIFVITLIQLKITQSKDVN